MSINVIIPYTYGEIKEMAREIPVENNMDIDDDVYGLVIDDIFIPIKPEGTDEYLRQEGNYENWLKGEIKCT
jgi:spore coat protein CotH